jgi:hypothetical protein
MRLLRFFSAHVSGVVVLLLFACDGSKHDHDNFREDVIMCEDAVAYLSSCCPGFNADAITCYYAYDYSPGNCSTYATVDTVDPALSIDESRCILARTCDTLRGDGVCDRAQTATPYASHTGGNCEDCGGDLPTGDTSSSHAAVCP